MTRRLLLPVVVFAAVTFVFTWPLSLRPGELALDLGPDTRLFLWTLSWDWHALLHRPLGLFDANIFFPESRTLAYSEHLLGSAVLAAPAAAAGADPLLSMNLVLLGSCLLSALGAFYLARVLGLSTPAAVVCGIVFAFAPPRLFRLGQLHLATVQWTPLCLALLHRYANRGTTRHLVGASVCFTLQAWSGGQTGLFLALAGACLVAYLGLMSELRPKSSLIRDAVLVLPLVFALNAPFAFPYLEVRRSMGLERSLVEAERWSPNPESFIASPAHGHRLLLRAAGALRRIEREAKAYLFPGLFPLLLAALALARRDRSARPPPRPAALLDALVLGALLLAVGIEAAGGLRLGPVTASGGERALAVAALLLVVRLVRHRGARFGAGVVDRWRDFAEPRMGVSAGFYVLLAAGSLWASLGPPGGLYRALYGVVPGFGFIRVPSRLTLLTLLALALLAGYGYERLARGRKLLTWGVPALILAELAAFPLEATPYRIQASAMDDWLEEQPGEEAVAVLPVPDPDDEIRSASRHSAYMLSSIPHFRPLVNGYSGFSPPPALARFRRLSRFPHPDSVLALQEVGVGFVVLRRDGYDPDRWPQLLAETDALADLTQVADFEDGRVYRVSAR